MASQAFQVIGVTEIQQNTRVPFVLVRKISKDSKETMILRAGVGITFQVRFISLHIIYCSSRKFLILVIMRNTPWLEKGELSTIKLKRR